MKNFINEWEKIDYRSKKTRTALLGALSSMIKEKRLTDITVSELAKRASITRKTFYNHYNSIEAMVNEVEERVIGTVVSILDTNKEFFRQGNMYEFFLRIAKSFQRHKDLWRLFSLEKENYRIIEKIKSYLERYVSANLKNIAGEAEVAKFKVSVYLDSLVGMFLKWMDRSMRVPAEKIAEMAAGLTTSLLSEYYSRIEKQD